MSKKDPKNEGPIFGSPRTIPSPGNVLSTIALESLKFEKKFNNLTTSSTAQGGGGSFKDRKPIGGVGC